MTSNDKVSGKFVKKAVDTFLPKKKSPQAKEEAVKRMLETIRKLQQRVEKLGAHGASDYLTEAYHALKEFEL